MRDNIEGLAPDWRACGRGRGTLVASVRPCLRGLLWGGVMSMVPLLSATAASLYVDRTVAGCNDVTGGSSPQTPFCTIGAAATKAKAGDTVTVLNGTYAERVRPANSGTAAAPIVFIAPAGSGVTVQGNINGFRLSGRSYITVRGFTVSGTSSYGFELLTAANISLIDNKVVNAGSYGIYVRESDNTTLSGNEVDDSVGHGIYVKLCTVNVRLEDNRVTRSGAPASGAYKRGIYVSGSSGLDIAGNTLAENTEAGIYLIEDTTATTVRWNTAHDNARVYTRAAPGIHVASSGNVVDGNIAYHNEDSGINVYGGAANTLVVNNLTYNNGDHGIDTLNSPSTRIIGNSVYGNITAGINVEGTSPGASIANNISVDNGINSPRTKGNIRVDSTSVQGTTLDYDLVYLSVPGTMFQFGTVFAGSLAALQSATGQEAHGLQASPLWVLQPPRDYHLPHPLPPVDADFHLSAGSPAIDTANAGVSGALAHDLENSPRAVPFDRGAYEF